MDSSLKKVSGDAVDDVSAGEPRRKLKLFFKKIAAGFFVGVGAIIPGLSGGILAVSMGLYKPSVDAFAGFFKAPKKNFMFLLPLAIGGAVGLLLFMFLLDWLLGDFRTAVICCFIGLVAGSIPSLIQECNAKGFKPYYLLFTIIGFVFAFSLIMGAVMTEGGAVAQQELNYFNTTLCGGILMIGVVLPGVSTSFVLMNMGLYENFLGLFTSVPKLFSAAHASGSGFFASLGVACQNVPLMLCALLGMIIVAVPAVLLVKKLLDRFHGQSYYLIFGVLLATMVGCAMQEIMQLVADTTFVLTWWQIVIYAVLLVGGFFLCLFMERFIRFKEDEDDNKPAEEVQVQAHTGK